MEEFVDKRKNYRFPAFEDNEGVKLPVKSERGSFLVEFPTVFSKEKPVVQTGEPTYEEIYHGEEAVYTDHTVRQILPDPYVPAKPEPLKRAHRPDFSYQGPPIEDSIIEVKKPVFYSEHRASLEKKLTKEKKIDERETSNAQPGKYKGRSYFVPKHIPSSIIPVEVTPTHSKQEIIDRLKKPKDSYLVLAPEEDRAFQYDEIEKKEITSFETQVEKPKMPFSRRELKKSQKNAKSTTKEEDLPAITRKKNEKKESVATKPARLEKSLSGIMEEEVAQSKGNRYFD